MTRSEGDQVVPRPPPVVAPADGAAGLAMNALPMLGSVGSIVLVTSTSAGGSGTVRLLAGGMFVLTTLGFVAVQVDRQRAQRDLQRRGARTAYLRHLAHVRERLRDAATSQRGRACAAHPHPAGVAALVGQDGGDRRPDGWATASPDDPLLVRWGCGRGSPDLVPVAPPEPEGEVDPVAGDALRRLLVAHQEMPALPLLLDLTAISHLPVVGADARAVVRALVVSAAHAAGPRRLRVAVVAEPDRLAHWEWVKWLPHAADPAARDATGPLPLLLAVHDEPAADVVRTAVAPGPAGVGPDAHVLLVRDAPDVPSAPPPPRPGVTVLLPLQQDPGWPGDRLVLGPTTPGEVDRLMREHGAAVQGAADRCGPASAEAAARRLAPLAPCGSTGTVDPAASDPVLTDLGLAALADPRTRGGAAPWRPRAGRDRLRVPIGTDRDGRPVHLDLKEAAHGGTGPHGLVVGATGSGKSELLRTLVLGLAATHSSGELNLVLVDYKGGATFAALAALPHTSALITNLADDAVLVERMGDALAGEVQRRQEVLRAAGPFASRHDLERARATSPDPATLPALPSLLVVVDEFSELLAAEPAFVDLFGTIGRLGRSLGVHLLLASQRLEEGRLRGLESHLSYRIALRTFSAAESRTVLGVPDAASLPAVPGAGYLRTDPDTLVRFTGAYVSGPTATPPPERPPPARGVLAFHGPFDRAPHRPHTPVPTDSDDPAPGPAPPNGPTLLEAVVGRLAGHGPAAHRVWLPPLDLPPALGDLLLARPDDAGPALLPLGLLDRPREQRREPLLVDLATAGGHLLVVGGPRSGTTTLLRTAVTALALTTTPTGTHVHVLDLGGGALAPLAGLPHVAGVATRTRPEVVRRLLGELRRALDERETATAPAHPRLVLVVDRWGALREGDGAWEHEVTALAARGPGLGLHVLAAARRWSDLRASARDLFGHRLELRLGDPLDSELDRRAAARVPPGRPGRGLAPGGHHLLVALPVASARDVGPAARDAGEEALRARVAAAWPGVAAPPLRLLPARVGLAEVRRAAGPGTDRLWLGIDEERLSPVGLDPAAEPHLLVMGDGGSGRSSVLRTLAAEIARTRPPEQAQLLALDPRRTLLGDLPGAHLLDHLGDDEHARTAVADLAAFLRTRLPGRDVAPASLRRRDWWRGAEVWVLVDDHELVTPSSSTAAGSPLDPLVALLPRARDVGLHLVVARRAGGAARAGHDPLLQGLRDLGGAGLLLSAGPEDGSLLGLRPAPAPPGRGRLVSATRAPTVVQIAWTHPAA